MVTSILLVSCIVLGITLLVCLIRGIIGPTVADRVIAINVIGTKTVVLISIVSFLFKETFFIDVALVYALISFLTTIMIAKYIEHKPDGGL
ncbi:MAG: multicomponent Na+:H+ antiporter subunit [Thermosediminibacterales bacterium]|nr:multicomponent Na+:H+ antiporter subunit [Thermosediminibacterales bacterium]